MTKNITPNELSNLILANEIKLQIKDLDDLIDNKDGLGAMGLNRDIDYFGFTKKIYLFEFEKLTPTRTSELNAVDIIYDKILNGEKIASPSLFVEWLDSYKMWLIHGHEGRGRIMALNKLYENENISKIVRQKITVHIFPNKLRRKDLTNEILNAKFISQKDLKFYDEEKKSFLIKPRSYEL